MKPFLLSVFTMIGFLLAMGQKFWINLQGFLKVVLLKWPVSIHTASWESKKAHIQMQRLQTCRLGVALILMAFGLLHSSTSKAQITIVGWDGFIMNYEIYNPNEGIFYNPYASTGIPGNINASIMKTFGGVSHASASTWFSDNNTVIFNANTEPGNWSNGSGTKGWIFNFTTTGYSNLKFSGKMGATYAPDISWYGPRDFKLQYSLDKISWTDVSGGTIAALPDNKTDSPNLASISNVSLPPACDNQPIVYLRMVMTSNLSVINTIVGGGNSIQDDFMVKGTPLMPIVTTNTVTQKGAVKATMGGNVTAEGATPVTERGIVWGTTANPTILNNKVAIGSGLGSYSSVVSSLPPATLINFRAYAINSWGISYGTNRTFTTNAALSATTSQTNISCNGGNNGAASVIVTGGVSPYLYSWSPSGGTEATATGLVAGNYTCTITDNESTTINKNFTLAQPSALTASTAQTNVACNGGNNGAINLTPTGGTPPYTYNWVGGITTEDRTGLVAGTYTCQITDVNGCTATVSATVTQPAAPVSGSTVVTNVACNGGTNGAINLTPSGGTGPYTYNWTPGYPTGDGTAMVTGLPAGIWTCIITDAKGCTGTVSATVTQPTPVSGSTVVTNVSCYGGTNGAINLTPSGGTGPYTFNWGSGITTEDRTGLAAGSYICIITDVNGCTGTVSATISQPAAPVSGSTVVTNVACKGGTNGAINLTATGGAAPYTYHWNGGITTEDRTGLMAGSYSVIITDANGCTGTINVTVTQPAAPVSASFDVSDVSNFGGTNGTINLTPIGGTPPYTYNWVGGITTEDRTGLTAGLYIVTITDANWCSTTKSCYISEPAAITTGPVTNIGITSATIGGDVMLDGGASVTERGVVYSATDQTPTIEEGATPVAMGTGTGIFSQLVSSLTAETTYYLQAYAINQAGISYGGVQNFTTLPVCENPSSGGIVELDQSICSGAVPDVITNHTLPGGYTGMLEYKWQSSTTDASSGFQDIASSNSVTYAPGELFANTWYKRLVKASCISDWTGAAESNTVKITVNELPLAPVAETNSYIYDGTVKTALANVAEGETVVWYTDATGGTPLEALSGTNAGTYSAYAQAKNTNTGCVSASRTLVTLTIDKAILTVTADAQTKVYGESNPTLSFTYTGWKNGDTETVLDTKPEATTTVDQFSEAGTYPGAIILTGGADNNYDFIYVPANFTVIKLNQTITFDPFPVKTYGDEPFIITAASNSGLDISYTSSNPQVAIISGHTLTIVGRGKTIIRASQPGNNLYTASSSAQELTVGAKPLTVSGAAVSSKTYDGNTVATIRGASLSGILASDDVTLENSTNGTFARSTTGTGIPVSTSMLLSGEDADNYFLLQPEGLTAHIEKKDIMVAAQPISKECHQSDPTLTYHFTPELIINDSFSGNLTREEGDEPGEYEILIGSLSLNDNYNLIYQGATFSIVDNAPSWITHPNALDRTVEFTDTYGLAEAQSLVPVAFDICDNEKPVPVKVSGKLKLEPDCALTGKYINTWTVQDKAGNSSEVYTQVITIKTHNEAPKIDQIMDLKVTKNTSKLEVLLSGIDPTGGCDHQEIVSLTAEAANSTLIPEILVSYEKGFPTGMLTLKIAENMVGESQVNVTLKDNGGSENSGIDTKVMTFIVKVAPITDIQESKEALQLVAYPNPTKGIITINGMRPYKEINIAVYSIDGRLIMTKICSTTTNQIDLTNQVPGTYLLNVNKQTIKITKE